MERLAKAYPGVPGFGYQLALIYLQQNKLEPAGAALKRAITANPDFAEAIILLAQVNLRSGNAEAVIPAMTELLKKHPDFTAARLLLAEGHQLMGRLDDAVKVIQELITSAPQDSQSSLLPWASAERAKKNEEARKAFEKVHELNPENAAATDQLIDLDIANKDFDGAMSKAQQELTRAPNATVSHYLVGKVHAAANSWGSGRKFDVQSAGAGPEFLARV